MLDKDWVHLCRADPAYQRGASDFVRVVSAALVDGDMIVCPCIDCRNIDRHIGSVVVDHLVRRGMDEDYKRRSDWYHHGELNSGVEGDSKFSQMDEIYGLYQAAEFMDDDFVGDDEPDETADCENKKEDDFFAKLADAATPLYPSCVNHSKLSAIVSLFRLKTQNGWSDKSFNDLLETLSGMLPKDNVLHTSLYDVKKFFKSFDMGYQKIDACVNDCCLFRKKYKDLENCPKCKASRWKTNTVNGEVKKGVPQKVLRYFPIIPRLKRMFRSEEMAKDLRWHHSNKSNDGKLRHPVDSVTWDQMNAKYPSFAAEERNVRLGLSTDGFNPFDMKNNNYSCWPVLLVNYNLPPDLCMKKENIMLTLLIPGPKQPGNSIDVYLEPLIDDLIHLWNNGETTYDAFSKSTFNLKAMLLWTISDFPAYGNLAGCKVKGQMACPLCGKNTDSLWLKFSRKHVYMCHRKRLPATHSFRLKKSWFDGKTEPGIKGRILTGKEISQNLKNFKNDFGNLKRSGRKRKKTESNGMESDDEELSRTDVWVRSRTRKDGTPVNTDAAEKIKKAAELVNSVETNEGQDTLVELLGPDNPGRMRAMGRNMTKTKLACFQVNHKCMVEMEKKQIHLLDKVNELENKLGKLQNQGQETEVGENSRSAARSVNKKAQPKCILIDWAGDDANVAEGRIISTDPEDVVNGIRLGPLDYKVLVETATVPEAFLWRNAMGMSTIEESVGHMIPWPATKCVSLEQGVQEEDMAPLGTRANSLNKCKLLDLSNDDVVVAEGRWTTQDRKALVNGLSLGPKAVKVFVDVVHEANTFIWRPTMDVTYIEDCLMSFVAWPFNKVVFENNPDGTGRLSPIQNYASTQTAHGKSASSSQKSTATGSKSQPAHGRSASASKQSAATGSKSHMQPISASCEKSPTTVPKSNAVETQTAAPSPLRRSPRKKGAILENQKCMLLDIKERKQVVAKGRVISTDPERRVHCAPLGLNAAQVLVDIVQVDDAAVWRTSYEIEYMKDALGSFIAWPTDNLVMY